MNAAIAQLWHRWRQSKRQRIFIMPSRYGFAYAGLLLLMLLGAINYNNSLGHLLCFLLASLGQVNMYHSHRNLTRLNISLTATEPVFCGQQAGFRLTINNNNVHPCYQLQVAFRQEAVSRFWQFLRGYQPAQTVAVVAAESTSSCLLPITSHQRGWLTLNAVRLASLYPLGLFFTWTVFEQPVKTLVYPKPAGNRPLPPLPVSGTQGLARQQKGEDDFAGLGNYRSGESLHRVAWKALARDDIMRSKQFVSPEGQTLMLRWQDVVDLADTEARLSQLCNWVLQAEKSGLQYGLELPAQLVEPSHGLSHQHHCLKALALYG